MRFAYCTVVYPNLLRQEHCVPYMGYRRLELPSSIHNSPITVRPILRRQMFPIMHHFPARSAL